LIVVDWFTNLQNKLTTARIWDFERSMEQRIEREVGC
jgi:hypothetical protein